jgi:hypothetical protein
MRPRWGLRKAKLRSFFAFYPSCGDFGTKPAAIKKSRSVRLKKYFFLVKYYLDGIFWQV